MHKLKGSNLVEYVIPIAVIALLAGGTMFIMSSNGSMLNFTAHSSNMKVDMDQQKGTINMPPEESLLLNPLAGSLGGSPDNPIGKCSGNKCTIDYGNFIISNIPVNFNDFVQTSGTAGSFKNTASHLKQISKDFKDQGLFEIADQIELLANMGHNIALIFEEYERVIQQCNGNQACITAFENQPFPMPAGFDESIFEFPANATYKDLIDSGAFGAAVNNLNSSPFAAAYMDQLTKITSNKDISDEAKGVISEITWNLGVLGQDFQNNVASFYGQNINYYDPLTGELLTQPPLTTDPYQNFNDYNASKVTDYYSSLICATGYNKDTGKKCH